MCNSPKKIVISSEEMDRRHEWEGKTLSEALDKMTVDVDRWEWNFLHLLG